MKNIQVHLYKNSDCDLCKLMQEELTNNPPNAEVVIHTIKNSLKAAEKFNITLFPTIIVIDNDKEIYNESGFITSDCINSIIKDYEAEFMV